MIRKKEKFYYFANYFDVVINAIFALIVSIVFIDNNYQDVKNYENTTITAFIWAIIIYLSLIITNGRFIRSLFAIPFKALFSIIFLIAGSTMIRSIFLGNAPLKERIKNGIFSGFVLYLCNKLVKR